MYVEKNTSQSASVEAGRCACGKASQRSAKKLLDETAGFIKKDKSSVCSHEAGTLAAHG